MHRSLLLAAMLAIAGCDAGPSTAADNTVTNEPAAATDSTANTTGNTTGSAAGATSDAAADSSEAAANTTTSTTAATSTPEVAPDAPIATAGGVVVYPDDHVLGAADASVTLVEYASLTCPHCATFHSETLPRIKSEYVDKGRVRYVYRNFLRNQTDLQAALVAECTPPDRYFGMIQALMDTQPTWSTAPDSKPALNQMAQLAGLDLAALDACVQDEAVRERLLNRHLEAEQKYGVHSTPSFLLNGKLLQGGQSFEEFDKSLKEALPKS